MELKETSLELDGGEVMNIVSRHNGWHKQASKYGNQLDFFLIKKVYNKCPNILITGEYPWQIQSIGD